jgi:ankyrin repeat protein
VKKGNYLNVPDTNGNAPLILCVAVGNIDIVSCLVSDGSGFNTCYVQGDNPLTLVVK